MLIQQGKSNIKYLLIVIILAAIIGGGVLWYATKQEIPSIQFPKISKKTTVEFPIDNEKEAIVYAKTDSDVKEFIEGLLKEGFKIGSWAYFDKEQNFWAVGIYPDSPDIRDYWYEIHFLPDGEILQKGRGLGV